MQGHYQQVNNFTTVSQKESVNQSSCGKHCLCLALGSGSHQIFANLQPFRSLGDGVA